MELETKVEMYRVDKQCEKCKEGLMYSTGHSTTEIDPICRSQYQVNHEHKCNKCDDVVLYINIEYPFFVNRDNSETIVRKKVLDEL